MKPASVRIPLKKALLAVLLILFTGVLYALPTPEFVMQMPLEQKDAGEWQVLDSKNVGPIIISVLLPKGIDPKDTKESIIHTVVFTEMSAKKFMAQAQATIQKDPKAKFEEIEAPKGSVACKYTVPAAKCVFIQRVIRARDALYIVDYAMKPELDTEENNRKWIDIISETVLYSNPARSEMADGSMPKYSFGIPFPKDGHEWQVSTETDTGQGYIKEMIPAGDQIDDWKELLTQQVLPIPLTPMEFKDRFKDFFLQKEPDSTFEDEVAPDGVLIRTVSKVGKEISLRKIVSRDGAIYSVSYNIRPKLANAEKLRQWRNIIRNAKLAAVRKAPVKKPDFEISKRPAYEVHFDFENDGRTWKTKSIHNSPDGGQSILMLPDSQDNADERVGVDFTPGIQLDAVDTFKKALLEKDGKWQFDESRYDDGSIILICSSKAQNETSIHRFVSKDDGLYRISYQTTCEAGATDKLNTWMEIIQKSELTPPDLPPVSSLR